MSSKIGKVTLNYDYFSGNDACSDNTVINKILETVKAGKDPEEVLLSETDGDMLCLT